MKMFTGRIIHEESWDAIKCEFTRSSEDCFIEACGGNKVEGFLIQLFDHWGNDIESLAPFYGINFERDSNGKAFINENIPAPPSISPEKYYWDEGQWKELSEFNDDEMVA
jgi:hypothetical protein